MLPCESVFRGRRCRRLAARIVRVRSYDGSGTVLLLCLCRMHEQNVKSGMVVQGPANSATDS